MARYPIYAPDYRLKISGDTIPAALRANIISINYQDGMEGADRVEVTIANDNLRWLDNPLLQVDNKVSLSLGYVPDPLEEVFVGEVTGVETNFPNSGMPTIKLICPRFSAASYEGNEGSWLPDQYSDSRKFPVAGRGRGGDRLRRESVDPVSRSSGRRAVGAHDAGDVCCGTGSRTAGCCAPAWHQRLRFSDGASKKNGWEMFIDHTQDPVGYRLRFKFMLSEMSSSLTLKWGSSLMNFTPRITTVGDAGISVRVWVSSLKMSFTITVAWDFDRASFNLSVSPGFETAWEDGTSRSPSSRQGSRKRRRRS